MLLLHVAAGSVFAITAPISLFARQRVLAYISVSTGGLTLFSGLWLMLTTSSSLGVICARTLALILVATLIFAVLRKRAALDA